jgi:two-component system KDP operon response regulator KdpE
MGQRSILVVDQDPATRALMSAILEREGYAVRATVDGSRVLDSVAQSPPSLVLMGVRLPLLPVRRFATELSALGLQVPIVVLAGGWEMRRWAQAIGADAFFVPPFDLHELLSLIAAMCT